MSCKFLTRNNEPPKECIEEYGKGKNNTMKANIGESTARETPDK